MLVYIQYISPKFSFIFCLLCLFFGHILFIFGLWPTLLIKWQVPLAAWCGYCWSLAPRHVATYLCVQYQVKINTWYRSHLDITNQPVIYIFREHRRCLTVSTPHQEEYQTGSMHAFHYNHNDAEVSGVCATFPCHCCSHADACCPLSRLCRNLLTCQKYSVHTSLQDPWL